jgi:REP element-mobilizing transposase RayT
MARPHRLPPDLYLGPNRYFLTLCCHGRAQRFDNPDVATMVRAQLLRTAADHRIAIHAYCLMPDHLHVLSEGVGDRSSLLDFVHAFKQVTAYEFVRRTGARLWQPSFFDRHLRIEEDLRAVARYIFDNPVRAGLVIRPQDHPYSGSATLEFPEILSSIG